MVTRLYVDVEGPVRSWLRAQTAVTTLATGGIYFGTPTTTPSSPWVTLQLVNDVPDPNGQTPYTIALIQVDCYAPKPSTKADAAALGAAVVTAFESLSAGTLLNSTTRAYRASVRRWQFLPDMASALPRYSIDVELAVIATGN